MRNTIVDNSTLTSVQRLLGKVEIRNKNTIDGDILAFENLIQAILFNDEILYLDDYKDQHKATRKDFFKEFGELSLSNESYSSIIRKTQELSENIVPQIEGGKFTDQNFKPFFDLLRMHNTFTWDMSSSVYYLTQKLLQGNSGVDIEKYSKLSAMMFSELDDKSFIEECHKKKPILVDSRGKTITSDYIVIDKEGYRRETHISEQSELFFANLNWLAFRTIFYTLVASETGVNLVLNPIRNSFQVNFLSKLNLQNSKTTETIIKAINGQASDTLGEIYKVTDPMVVKNPLPMFSAYLAHKTQNPLKIMDAAYELREEKAFVQARQQLDHLDALSNEDKNQKYMQDANKLVLSISKLMERICIKYKVSSPQGISVSPLISAFNMLPLLNPAIPPIPNFSAKITFLGRVKDIKPQRGFNAVYKSLIQDLSNISKLGSYHEILTSKISLHRDARNYDLKIESEKFSRYKSNWKIPM